MSEKMMKGIVFESIGKHKFKTLPIPEIKEDDELLVKIEASSICGSDVHILADPPGAIAVPGTVIGHEMVGHIIGVGKKVDKFKVGDRIVCDPNISCGTCYQCKSGHKNMCQNLHIHGVDRNGFFAEYACIPERSAFKISETVPADTAVFAEPLTCVVGAVNKVRALPGENVVVIGAGPIGLFFLSLFKANGAGKLISVEMSDFRKERAKDFGADYVFNPKTTDVQAEIMSLTNGIGADTVVDAVGMCIGDAIKYVSRNGKILLFGQNSAATENICQNDITRNELTVYGSYIGSYSMEAAIKLLESGIIDFSKMVTHRISLDEFDKGLDAMRKGQALKVIISP